MKNKEKHIDERANRLFNDDLVLTSLDGKQDAWKQLVDSLGKYARHQAYSMIPDEILADDIVQEAFVKIFHRVKQGKSINHFKTYLKKTVKHLCIDWLKRQKEFTNQDEFWGQYNQHQTIEPEFEMDADSNDGATEAVFQALAELPEIQRKVLILHYFDVKPYSVIAAELGIQEKTARNISYESRKKMKELLLRNVKNEICSGTFLDFAVYINRNGFEINRNGFESGHRIKPGCITIFEMPILNGSMI